MKTEHATTDTIPQGTGMLVIPSMINPVEFYSDRHKITTILDDIGCQAHAVEHDVSTVKGRALIAGTAYKVARSKTYLDGLGKALVAEIKQQAAAVDAERKYIRDTLDELRDSIRKPLDEWEAVDEARKNAIKARLDRLGEVAASMLDTPSSLDAKVVQLNAIMDYQWEEYASQAAIKFSLIRQSLENAREVAIARLIEIENQKEVAAQQEAEKAKLEAERRELAEMRAKLINERTVESAPIVVQPVVVPTPQQTHAPEQDSQFDKWTEARKTIQSWITFGMHTNVTDYIAYLESQS